VNAMSLLLKEKPFDWRELLTNQEPVKLVIPSYFVSQEHYISEFERLNGLVPTVPCIKVPPPPVSRNKQKRDRKKLAR